MFFELVYKDYRSKTKNILDNYHIKLIEILTEYIKEINFDFQIDLVNLCNSYKQRQNINVVYWMNILYKDIQHPTYVVCRTFLNYLVVRDTEAFFYMVDFLIQKDIIKHEKVTSDIQKLFYKYK